jgi:ubiquitin carboxyl-terminal hydrolase L3
MSSKQWFPLESNPEVMNDYVSKLGLDVTDCAFVDVMSTEDWALEMVPKPVIAVLMLYPIKEASENYRLDEEERINNSGQILSDKVYYMKQTVGKQTHVI